MEELTLRVKFPDNMEWDSDNDGISDKQESLEDMTESLSELGVAAVNSYTKKRKLIKIKKI